MAEQRIVPLFVLAVTLMGTWVGLIATMPPNLISASTNVNYKKPSVPTEFSALDITKIAWYDNDTIGPSNTGSPRGPQGANPVQFMLPPLSPQIEVWGYWGTGETILYFNHVWMDWIFRNGHAIEGLDNVGYGFDKTEIVNHWDANQNCSEIDATCPCGTIYYIFIGYNQSKYQSIGHAIDNKEVIVLIGVGIEDAVAKVNAWNIIGALLIFQLPDINPLLNFFIALPFYAGMGVMIYVLILMAIPFVGG